MQKAEAKDIMVEEFQPVPPHFVGAPRSLIIGTFPPARNRWDYAFFFPNRQNRLWNTLARVAAGKLDARMDVQENEASEVAARKAVLQQLDCAMLNIIRRCLRKNGSALDNDLEVLELEDVVGGYLRKFPSIQAIYLTSLSGKNSCLSLLKRHLADQGISVEMAQPVKRNREERIADPLVFSFNLEGRRIQVYALFSPSPTSLRSGITEEVLFRQYKKLNHG